MPDKEQAKPTVDDIILDLVHQGSTLPRGKTINAGMFPEAKAALEALIAESINCFVEWHNGKYDSGYESGIAPEHVNEYLSQLTPTEGDK